MNTDVLLTLNEARFALIGERASRPDAWPSLKTLRRAYGGKQLAVFQRVPGGRVMVWQSELMRWASVERAQTPQEDKVPQPPTAPVPPSPPKHGAKRTTASNAKRMSAGNTRPKTGGTAKPPVVLASRREHNGVPPRLSLAELRAA